MTYRMRGHYEGDPTVYRDKEIKKEWAKKDPIENFKTYILKEGFDEKELTAIEESIDKEIEAAVQFALDSPLPDPSEVTKDVYASDNERCVVR